MVSGFWGVSHHGRLQSAFDSHSEALAFAVLLPSREKQVEVAMDALGRFSAQRR
jgi:hypothetical protein